MKRPYIEHQEIHPLQIRLNGKPVYTYDPSRKQSPLNLETQNTTEFKQLQTENKQLQKEKKELEAKVNQMYGENIVWI